MHRLCALLIVLPLALAAPLRRLPRLKNLLMHENRIGDEGIAALVAPGEVLPRRLMPEQAVLPSLEMLYLEKNRIQDAGCASLTHALNTGVMPRLGYDATNPDAIGLDGNPASEAARRSPGDACRERLDRVLRIMLMRATVSAGGGS